MVENTAVFVALLQPAALEAQIPWMPRSHVFIHTLSPTSTEFVPPHPTA
jgi:hypothetical protein